MRCTLDDNVIVGKVMRPVSDTREPPSLTDRLLAALDAEQQIAEAAGHDWGLGALTDGLTGGTRAYLSQVDPARTLRRVVALRRIVERHRPECYRNRQGDTDVTCCCGDECYPCPDLLGVAAALGVEP